MKPIAWAALAASVALVGSVATRSPRPKESEESQAASAAERSQKKAPESGVAASALSQLAFDAANSLASAARKGGQWAHDAGLGAGKQAGNSVRWPAMLAQPAPSAQQLSRYEKELCDLANRERKQRGLPTLKISPVLAEVARGHSREMAAKNYFAHESPTKGRRSPQDRYRARVKETPRLIAENIYKLETSGFYKLGPADFRRAHEGWMKSPGHKANILRKEPAGGPTQIGVGIVMRNGSFWATQNFARP